MLANKWYNESVEGVGRFSFCHYRAVTYPSAPPSTSWQKIGSGFMIRENEMEIDDKLFGNFIRDSHSGCWEWVKGTNKGGYGIVHVHGKSINAHRYSWEAKNGKIPDGMYVCHKCDNTRCINPDHLFLGSPDENVKDMFSKKRNRAQFAADPAMIAAIEAYWAANPNASLRDCANEIGCSPMTAGKYKP